MNASDRVHVEAELRSNLTECQNVVAFAKAGDLGNPATKLDVRDGEVSVLLYHRDDGAVVALEHAAGAGTDTAFSSSIDDAHSAVVELADACDCDVVRDGFGVLD